MLYVEWAIVLHHDNAPVHTAHAAIDYLRSNNIELINNPVFSEQASFTRFPQEEAECVAKVLPVLKERLLH